MLPPSCIPVGVYPSGDGSNMTQPVSLLHEWWPRWVAVAIFCVANRISNVNVKFTSAVSREYTLVVDLRSVEYIALKLS